MVGAKVEFNCDECERTFTTKQGRNRHKTMTHTRQKEKKEKENQMKRTRSVPEKSNSSNFKCNSCPYSSRSKWALKAHINHTHKEPTSPSEKKPKINAVIVEDIISEVVQNIPVLMEEDCENKSKTTIEPTKDFLTNTAVTLAEMLDDIADQINENTETDDDDNETIDFENRLDILRGDQPRNKNVVDDESEKTLVTLPLKDVEELRLKLRNLEEINENLTHTLKDVDELKDKYNALEDKNKELVQMLKENRKNKERTREKFIVIDMETNNEDDDIEQLVRNKEHGFSRSNPQSEAGPKNDLKLFDCPNCEKKFKKREHLINHQKNHEVACSTCAKTYSNISKLQDHIWSDHDEMICHTRCEGGVCTIGDTEDKYKCNFCDQVFQSRNGLSTHKADIHRTYKPCRDPINCVYQAGCYFSHVPVTTGKFRCFQCGDEFETKSTMMMHRRIHGGVKQCKNQSINQCSRGNSCWWNHEVTDQVFQKVQENLPPPIQNREQMQQQTSQSNQNQFLLNMLNVMETELKKIKDTLNII